MNHFSENYMNTGADPGFVERGGGAAAVPFEDSLWNFKRGGGRRGRVPSLTLLEDPLWNFKRGRAPPAPPPLNPLVEYMIRIRSMYLKWFKVT